MTNCSAQLNARTDKATPISHSNKNPPCVRCVRRVMRLPIVVEDVQLICGVPAHNHNLMSTPTWHLYILY